MTKKELTDKQVVEAKQILDKNELSQEAGGGAMSDPNAGKPTGSNVPSTQTTTPRGFEEETDSSDLLIPRAKKLEALSPEMQEDDTELKQGDIINSITLEVLPEEFIPVFFFKQWIRFNPRDVKSPDYNKDFGPGDIVYRTNNSTDPRLVEDAKWIDDKPPKATAFLNFLSYFPGQAMPIIVSFCNTSYKTGKTLLTLAKFTGGDMFSKKYSLKTVKTKNDQGTFHVLKIKLAGIPEKEDYARALELYDALRGKDIKVHQENEQTTSVPF